MISAFIKPSAIYLSICIFLALMLASCGANPPTKMMSDSIQTTCPRLEGTWEAQVAWPVVNACHSDISGATIWIASIPELGYLIQTNFQGGIMLEGNIDEDTCHLNLDVTTDVDDIYILNLQRINNTITGTGTYKHDGCSTSFTISGEIHE